MRRAAVVYNPLKVDIERLRAAVSRQEAQNGWATSLWFETNAEDLGRGAARQALDSAPDVVLIVGGDGTIRAVSEEVHGSGIPVALVPAGTGNLLARNLGLPVSDLDTSVRTAFTGAGRSIDVAFAQLEREDHTLTEHAFLVMAGIGLDASMAANTNAALKRRIGWLAYAHPIARSVIANKHLSMRYSLDEGPSSVIRAHTVIVGNCSTLTANILLLPDALVDDGLLDVVVLRPAGVGGWARIGSRLAVGGVLHRTKTGRVLLRAAPGFRALQYVQAKTMSVRFDEPENVELDGDDFGLVTGITITVSQHALTIRVPGPASVPALPARKRTARKAAQPV